MSKGADKVVINTGILYGKMILTMGISLYTTRVVLDALGESDYGIYNLVAGAVALLSFLNAAMSTSTQRYLSVSQGKSSENILEQKNIFSNSFLLHLMLAFFLVIALSIAGVLLFDGFLNIPADRILAAQVIYAFMILTVFLSVLSVPFVASINAHENMLWIAIVGIVEVLLKLGIALALPFFLGDKLIYYGGLIAIIAVISFVLYTGFCLLKYQECSLKIRGVFNPPLAKELISFAGWNMFGAGCSIGRSQGIAIILNLFYGTIVNTAYGLANQVVGQMSFFSVTMLRALNPQIMKSEGAGDRTKMLKLTMMASKFAFLLLAFFAIPCIFEMEKVLSIWLKEIPEYTVAFCQLILISILVNQLTIGLQSAFQAIGKIKTYQMLVGGILLLNLPIAYLILRSGLSPYYCLFTFPVIELIACGIRLVLFKYNVPEFSLRVYVKDVFLRLLLPVTLSILTCLFVLHFVNWEYRFLITILCSSLVFALSVYLLGLSTEEKRYVNMTLYKLIKK